MPDIPQRLPDVLNPTAKIENVDGFLFMLESLLPAEAEVMWVSPAAQSEQLISVRYGEYVIYFSGEDLSGDDFLNWHDFYDPQKLKKCLKRRLKIDRAHSSQSIATFVRQAIHALGMEELLVIETHEDRVSITDHADGNVYGEIYQNGSILKTFQSVRAEVEAILEIPALEGADNFKGFVELFESVNANEFQGAFTFAPFNESDLEITYGNGKRKRKKNFIRIWIDEFFWKEGVNRKDLVDFLTDQIKERLDDRRLEYLLFMNLFRQVAADYPDLKYRIGLNNARFVSADRRQCYFLGIRGKVEESLKPTPYRFCAENGYQYGEIDCGNFLTESAFRTFLEYDLGYASPKKLLQSE